MALTLKNAEPCSRRCALLAVPLDLLARVMSHAGPVEFRGVPPGARVTGAWVNQAGGMINLVLEHESFEPVDPGRYIPELAADAELFTWEELGRLTPMYGGVDAAPA